MDEWFLSLKQERCPYCGQIATLNGHGKIYGNDHAQSAGCVLRGRRCFCSNRGRSNGCGRTFSVLLSEFLPRHSITTQLLQTTLDGIEKGRTVKAIWETLKTKLALESFYHLLRRLRHGLDRVRCALSGLIPAPHTEHRDPFLQTVAHLRNAFHGQSCPVAAFQCRLQKAFPG